MRLTTKLIGFAVLAGATAYAVSKRKLRGARGQASQPADEMGFAPDVISEVVIIDAEVLGLSDVDPEGLIGMGEGIDPERVAAAHEEIPEQRERLPIRGRNVP